MNIRFEWDRAKADANERKHRTSFLEALTAFGDPLAVALPDVEHSVREERVVLLGRSVLGRVLVVVHVEHGDVIRIISARAASPRERRSYERGN